MAGYDFDKDKKRQKVKKVETADHFRNDAEPKPPCFVAHARVRGRAQ